MLLGWVVLGLSYWVVGLLGCLAVREWGKEPPWEIGGLLLVAFFRSPKEVSQKQWTPPTWCHAWSKPKKGPASCQQIRVGAKSKETVGSVPGGHHKCGSGPSQQLESRRQAVPEGGMRPDKPLLGSRADWGK